MARFDNYTVYLGSFNLSGCRRDKRPIKINFYYWTREEVDPLFSFQSLPSLPNFFHCEKKQGIVSSLRDYLSRRKKRKKRNDLTSYWYLSIDVHFNSVIISNIEYSRVQWTNLVGFSREFFHSLKEILCPLIIISIYPISRNYKIPFRFALFERKSFLTILRNF